MATSQDRLPLKLLLAILALILPTCNGLSPIVNTAAGRVRGSVVSGVSFFSAIPYGTPPTGNLRFEVPQKATPWQGVFDATQQGNICFQSVGFFSLRPGSPPESEDCLSLDVYVPRDLSSSGSRPLSLLPVLLYIHGGGFTAGSRRTVNGTIMAKREDIIVVTINYRLGLFGFIGLDDSDIPGNAGLYDQRLALQWVRENIRAFGGNPNKVTIYGESAGSFSVNMHVLSPLSKGLFSGAIMSSGIEANTLSTRAEAARSTTQIAATLGCDTSSPRAVLSCLRNQDTRNIVTANPFYAPFVDGSFLVEQPIDSLMCGRFNRVPVIAGFTSEDGQLMMFPLGFQVLSDGIPQNQIGVIIGATVNATYQSLTEEHRLIIGNLANAFYFNGDPSDHFVNLRSALDIARDMFFSAPTVKLAKHFSKVGVPVYLYEFDESLAHNGNLLGRSAKPPAIPVGAYHADDFFYVWGVIEKFPLDSTPEKIQFSKELSAAWSSFIRDGKPSLKTIRGQQLDWKAYTEDDPSYAHLKADVTSIKKGPASKADLVWNKVMGAVEDRKPKCSLSTSTGQSSWFWMYNWGPGGYWWRWWMSGS